MLHVRVIPGIEDRIRGFHPWVYKPEISSYSRKPRKGEVVVVRDFGGKFLGYGYINPDVNIAIRILSFDKRERVSKELIKKRIIEAYDYRKRLYVNSNAFRLIHSEGDLLPGLIVDVYGEFVVVEFTTYGMALFRDTVVSSLVELLNPKGIYEKVNEYAQRIEGFKAEERVLYGEVPERITVWEHDLKYYVNIPEGQKTGFFLDQRNARKFVRELVEPGDECLDVFCHTGGFALNMKRAGAKRVIGIDLSKKALTAAEDNALLNQLEGIEWVRANAFGYLRDAQTAGRSFDVVIIDPPSFTKNKASVPNALRGYRELCLRGLKLTKRGGYFAIFSCSHHITEEHLIDVLTQVSYEIRRQVRVIAKTFQDRDHPWVLQMPNTLYLKGIWVEVL